MICSLLMTLEAIPPQKLLPCSYVKVREIRGAE
jgi:hypothetical protein